MNKCYTIVRMQFSLADSNIVLVADYDVIRDNKWAPLCHQSAMFVPAARVHSSLVSRVLLPHATCHVSLVTSSARLPPSACGSAPVGRRSPRLGARWPASLSVSREPGDTNIFYRRGIDIFDWRNILRDGKYHPATTIFDIIFLE